MLPPGLTGADLYAVVAEAASIAISRKILALEAGTERHRELHLRLEDFKRAANNFVPSISKEDLTYYQNVHRSLTNE